MGIATPITGSFLTMINCYRESGEVIEVKFPHEFSAYSDKLEEALKKEKCEVRVLTYKGHMRYVPETDYGQVQVTIKCNWLNKCGMIPVLSVFTGTFRVMLGLVHVIYHFVQSFFDSKNASAHLSEAYLGLYNIARGLLFEIATPVVGNIFLYINESWSLAATKKFFSNSYT